jgi:type IV pilus assembly protein PilC
MEGRVEAAGPEEARRILQQMDLTVQQIELSPESQPPPAVRRDEFLLFNQQLASLTRAGIPLEQGLRQLAQDAASDNLKRLMEEIAADLEAGLSLQEAFAKREKIFPPLYSLVLKAGIESGRLSEMLTVFNRYQETSRQIRRILWEALSYPAVVLLVSLLVLTLVCWYILPVHVSSLQQFADTNINLPLLTRFYIMVSHYIVQIWVGLFVLAAAVWWTGYALSFSPRGRRIKEAFLYRLPLLGRTLYSASLSRLAESMGLLVAAGCTLPHCLRLGGESSGSETLRQAARLLADHVESGGMILEAAPACRGMPMLFLYSLQIGCQRNDLFGHLKILGQMYTQRTQILQSYMQAVLGPIAIILLGLFIGSIVTALFLPYTWILSLLLM